MYITYRFPNIRQIQAALLRDNREAEHALAWFVDERSRDSSFVLLIRPMMERECRKLRKKRSALTEILPFLNFQDKLEDQLEQYRRRDEKREQLLKKYKTLGADEQLLQVRNYLSKLRRLLRSEECHVMIDTVEHFVEERTSTLKADVRKR